MSRTSQIHHAQAFFLSFHSWNNSQLYSNFSDASRRRDVTGQRVIHAVSVVFVGPEESPCEHGGKNDHAEGNDGNVFRKHLEIEVGISSVVGDDKRDGEPSKHMYSRNWDCS
ncbi:hypothetical protein BHYA_0056g00430 [Botrytis hyacinthi]|uniref:Uncharacterized protein n=1 Tax=Botrytis hyacinthi TaxID=278943 RepID=A0A4Z1GVG8_9HELO|nr:hypothetical protein BHYA_0056g00430 [Botrytis hyacinthi]